MTSHEHLPPRRRLGRLPNTVLQKARAVLWASTLKEESGLSLWDLEQKYILATAPDRVMTAYKSRAFPKYFRGTQTLTPPKHKGVPVVWAASIYPETWVAYTPLFGEILLRRSKGESVDGIAAPLLTALSQSVAAQILSPRQKRLRYIASQNCLDECPLDVLAGIGHLDAFAVLLFRTLKDKPNSDRPEPISYARQWLQHWSGKLQPLKDALPLVLEALETYAPELSPWHDTAWSSFNASLVSPQKNLPTLRKAPLTYEQAVQAFLSRKPPRSYEVFERASRIPRLLDIT